MIQILQVTWWLAIPGNHDVGDYGDAVQPVTAARRDRDRSVLPDRIQPRIGVKQVGVVEHALGDRITSTLVTPTGMATLAVGGDVDSPCDHHEAPVDPGLDTPTRRPSSVNDA